MKNIHHYFHHLSDSEQGGLPVGKTCHRRRTNEAGLVHLLGGLSLDGLAVPVRSPASSFSVYIDVVILPCMPRGPYLREVRSGDIAEPNQFTSFDDGE